LSWRERGVLTDLLPPFGVNPRGLSFSFAPRTFFSLPVGFGYFDWFPDVLDDISEFSGPPVSAVRKPVLPIC